MRLEGKVAVVTGAGRGIGRAVALAFAREGAAVVVNDVDAAAAQQVVDEIGAGGGRAAACVAGVGSKAAAQAIVATAMRQFGGLHILMNNAGITRDALLHKMSEEQWDEVLTVHLKGTFLNTQAAVAIMREQKYGKIINVTSHVAMRGNIGQSNYAAAKAGIIGLTLTWAKELARYTINVNAISPAAETRMLDTIPEQLRKTVIESMAREGVLQRFGQAEDVAPAAVFLACDESHYLTGQVIQVNGLPMQLL